MSLPQILGVGQRAGCDRIVPLVGRSLFRRFQRGADGRAQQNADRIGPACEKRPDRKAPGAVHIIDRSEQGIIDIDLANGVDSLAYKIDPGRVKKGGLDLEGPLHTVVLIEKGQDAVFISAVIGIGNDARIQKRG